MDPHRRRALAALRNCLSGAMLATLACALPAQAELPTLRSETAPYFTADLTVMRDREGRPSLVVAVSVPYGELQWTRAARGFMASLEFSVAIEPTRKGRGFGGAWRRELLLPSYTATRSQAGTVVERDTFRLPAGTYDLRVGIHDLQSDEGSKSAERVTIEDWSRVPVGFSDLELGTSDSVSGFRPRAGRTFGREVRALAGRVSIFDRRPGNWPRRYPLTLRLRDEGGNVLLDEPSSVSVAVTGEAFLVRPSRSDLFVGNYTLELELAEGRSRWRVERSFEVEESGPPQGEEFERMLEPLGYIAEAGEVEALQKLPAAEREAGWASFWQRRDPTPDTPRNEALIGFVRRVRYAEQHFQGFGPGWRSDMGRIYIRFGPPDQTETRPATVQSPQVEIWYYSQPYRRFVFVDREGFGRYVLLPSGIE